MNSLETPRFTLPLLAAGQAHKELFHNEALMLIDFLLHPLVKTVLDDLSSLTPLEGECWLIGSASIAEWEGRENHIAGWSGGGWRYIAPLEAMQITIQNENRKSYFNGTEWLTIEPVASPTGGAIIDQQARVAIDSILMALQTHGITAPVP